MKFSPVLLLGGNGFIGHALARQFAVCGIDYRIADRGDDWRPLLNHCASVVHLAASTTPGSSVAHPTHELPALELTLQLSEFLLCHPHVPLVYVSSGGTIYGDVDVDALSCDSPLMPRSFHGAGKASAEMFMSALRAQGCSVSIIRPANAYGPGQAMQAGFGFVRTALEKALRGQTLEIWGDGEVVRDFVYVDDIAEAILLALQQRTNITVNVGSSVGYSLNAVVELAREVCGRDICVDYRLARSADVKRVVLDISATKTQLGWQPRVSLAVGLRNTWEWLSRL